MPVALITGASLGLGRALATELARRGWSMVVDGRRADLLDDLVRGLAPGSVTAVPGDVADPVHRAALLAAVQRHGRLDLLVNNASRLGPSPLPHLRDYPLDQLAQVFEVDVFAPVALIQLHHPLLVTSGGAVVNITSDAGAEAYEGWGGYGSAKAALDQVAAVLAVEEPALRIYASSPEAGEAPAPERYQVPEGTAELVNLTRRAGGRVIATGTTVTRALETVADASGSVTSGHGWTHLALGPDHPARVVDGLITGWHAPGSSHMLLLEAVAGADLVSAAYEEAVLHGYLWHEFGDSSLLLPTAPRGQRGRPPSRQGPMNVSGTR